MCVGVCVYGGGVGWWGGGGEDGWWASCTSKVQTWHALRGTPGLTCTPLHRTPRRRPCSPLSLPAGRPPGTRPQWHTAPGQWHAGCEGGVQRQGRGGWGSGAAGQGSMRWGREAGVMAAGPALRNGGVWDTEAAGQESAPWGTGPVLAGRETSCSRGRVPPRAAGADARAAPVFRALRTARVAHAAPCEAHPAL